MNKYILLLFALLLFYSCSTKNKDIKNEVLSKKIVFPSDISALSFYRDSMVVFDGQHDNYAIVSYFDTTQCLTCDLQLYKWSRLIKDLNKTSKKEVACFLFFRHKNEKEVFYTLQKNHFLYPVFIDYNESFFKQNQMSSDITLQTFLIDKENRVIAYGNPIHDSNARKEYFRIILKK